MAAPLRRVVRIQEKGQVTLPADMRRELNLRKGDLVAVERLGDGVVIKPLEVMEKSPGAAWLQELYDMFAPVRAEVAAQGISEEALNGTIDAALRATRERHA